MTLDFLLAFFSAMLAFIAVRVAKNPSTKVPKTDALLTAFAIWGLVLTFFMMNLWLSGFVNSVGAMSWSYITRYRSV